MKFKFFLLPVLAVIACGTLQAQTSDATSSQSPGNDQYKHWHRHHHAGVWRKLNLTDAQKQQVKSIRQGSKAQFRPALTALLTARMKLQQDITANNQAAISTDASALAAAQSQIAAMRATQLSKVKAILSQDQLTTLNEWQQKRQTRMQDRINKLNQPAS
jgi:protein CpxP